MAMGRKEQELLERVASAFERNAKATEEMVAIATREEIVMERGPSVCPGCGKLNPEVTQLDGEGSGPLDDFVFMGETHCCNSRIYAIPDQWATTKNADEAIVILNERKGGT